MKLLLIILTLFTVFLSFGQTYEIEEMRLVATIQNIKGINEKTDEFCPVVSNDRIYFTSSRQYNKNSLGEGNWEKNGYLNVFDGAILKDENGEVYIKDIRLMSNKIKTKNHTGPVSFTKTGDTLFFTQVIQVSGAKNGVLNPQLFMAIRQKNKWKKIKLMPFSDGVNSFGHPSYDIRENRLYFASNKPGGKGQRDIYYSEIKDGKWTEPVGVESINTANDEKFPFVIGGNIFFSSDRENEKGDMDIYYSSSEPADYPIKLEGLNSDFDDFGVSLLPDLSAGYFSSNRDGSDDIYYFTIERVLTVKNQLAGRFTFQNLDAKSSDDLAVQIVDESGDFVYEENLNDKGEFVFEDILLDSNFSVRLKGAGEENMVLEFYSEDGNTTANFILDDEGSFRYKKIFYDFGGVVNFIPDNMKNFEKNTGNLSGKLVYENNPSKAFANAVVNLVDEDENIVFSTVTDSYGNFEFNDLSLSSNYFIQMPDCSDELIMYIYESEDIIYTQLKCNGNDYFMYQRLKPTDEYKLALINASSEGGQFMLGRSEIAGRFERKDGSKSPVQCEVKVFNSEGKLLGTTETDSSGLFAFNDLGSGETSYRFSTDSDENMVLTIYNRYGDAIAVIEEEDGHLFVFRPLGFKGDSNLSLMDDEVEFDLNFSDKYEAVVVYFNTNETAVKKEDFQKIDRIYNLMKEHKELNLSVSAYADAVASNEYNFALSQKRAAWIVSYLVKKGIKKNRFTSNAYGENELIDPNNNAINRRAELRIYK